MWKIVYHGYTDEADVCRSFLKWQRGVDPEVQDSSDCFQDSKGTGKPCIYDGAARLIAVGAEGLWQYFQQNGLMWC